jgi:hypothetical protein
MLSLFITASFSELAVLKQISKTKGEVVVTEFHVTQTTFASSDLSFVGQRDSIVMLRENRATFPRMYIET